MARWWLASWLAYCPSFVAWGLKLRWGSRVTRLMLVYVHELAWSASLPGETGCGLKRFLRC